MARRRSENRRAALGCPWGAWTGGAARSSGPEAPIFDADDEAGQEDAGAAASRILLGTRLRDLRESAGGTAEYRTRPAETLGYWSALNRLATLARPPAATAGLLQDVLAGT